MRSKERWLGQFASEAKFPENYAGFPLKREITRTSTPASILALDLRKTRPEVLACEETVISKVKGETKEKPQIREEEPTLSPESVYAISRLESKPNTSTQKKTVTLLEEDENETEKKSETSKKESIDWKSRVFGGVLLAASSIALYFVANEAIQSGTALTQTSWDGIFLFLGLIAAGVVVSVFAANPQSARGASSSSYTSTSPYRSSSSALGYTSSRSERSSSSTSSDEPRSYSSAREAPYERYTANEIGMQQSIREQARIDPDGPYGRNY